MPPHDEAVADDGHAEELIPHSTDIGSETGSSAVAREALDAAIRTELMSDVRRSYLDQAALGYMVYAVGAVTAFLAVALALSDAQAGVHSSALAVGMVAAGLVGDRFDHRFGIRPIHYAAFGLLVLAAILIAWAPAYAVTLLGATSVGLGAGLILGHVNQSLTAGGGVRARVQLSRSTLIAMLASVTVPVFIAVGIAIGVGWQFVVLPALVLIGIAAAVTGGRSNDAPTATTVHGRLARSYWLPWLLVVLVVAVEFAVIFWSSTLVQRRTGASLADATLTISAFIGGIIAGRFALSWHAVSRLDPVWLLRGGITISMFSVLLLWATSSYEYSAIGMFVAGIGLGMLFPLSASITLATAPEQSAVASARLVLASGLAILLSPLILGMLADVTSVTTAWLLIPAICVVALALTVPLARARRARVAGGFPA